MALGPGGTSIGAAPDGLQADVVERSGNWVRIRTDSWVAAEDVVPMPPDSARITLDQLRSDPNRFVGQPVTWRLQFLSVQTADELRPELPIVLITGYVRAEDAHAVQRLGLDVILKPNIVADLGPTLHRLLSRANR